MACRRRVYNNMLNRVLVQQTQNKISYHIWIAAGNKAKAAKCWQRKIELEIVKDYLKKERDRE